MRQKLSQIRNPGLSRQVGMTEKGEETEMSSRRRFVPAFVAFVALALSTGKPALAAPPTDACSMLTPAQVSAALGVTVGAGKAIPQNCEWSGNANAMIGKSVLLTIVGQMGSMTPVDQFNTIKTPLPLKGITKTPVSGLGDDAVYGTAGRTTVLTVRRGNFVFQVKVSGFAPDKIDEVKAKEKQLAQQVLAKL